LEITKTMIMGIVRMREWRSSYHNVLPHNSIEQIKSETLLSVDELNAFVLHSNICSFYAYQLF